MCAGGQNARKGVKIESTISIRGSFTHRLNRNISQPTPRPHKISPVTMATNIPAACPNEKMPTLMATRAKR